MEPDLSQFVVTAKATRPHSVHGQCCYCHQPLDSYHKADCVLIKKKVRARMTFTYEVDVPGDWGKFEVEFHRNDGGWCADNAIKELQDLAHKEGCLCNSVQFECLDAKGKVYLEE
jgi:hypothetical protein